MYQGISYILTKYHCFSIRTYVVPGNLIVLFYFRLLRYIHCPLTPDLWECRSQISIPQVRTYQVSYMRNRYQVVSTQPPRKSNINANFCDRRCVYFSLVVHDLHWLCMCSPAKNRTTLPADCSTKYDYCCICLLSQQLSGTVQSTQIPDISWVAIITNNICIFLCFVAPAVVWSVFHGRSS